MMEEKLREKNSEVNLSSELMLGTVASQSVETNPSDNVPVMWKIFGGAIVSVIFMLIITIFGYIITNINNVQNSINNLNSDMVKKPELNDHIVTIWGTLRQVDPLKDRISSFEQHLNCIESLKERLSTNEQKISTLESQTKSLQEENKTQSKDIQNLRERLAIAETALKKL